MDTKILVCIFNYRHDKESKYLLNYFGKYFDAIVLDSGNNHEEKDFIQFPNIYYSGLFNEMKKYVEANGYDWVLQICSDVLIDTENLDLLIKKIPELCRNDKIGIWQPGIDKTSRMNWHVGSVNKSINYISVNIIEGWMHCIRKEVLQNIPFIDVNQNLYGYGIDIRESLQSLSMGYSNIIDNTITVHNPAGTGYSDNDAHKQGSAYISKYNGLTLIQNVKKYYAFAIDINTMKTYKKLK